ncbi:MAG: efflux RND transporter periplasmic adaptor subunit, partial [Candidatus Sericytochromatia bacterium]
MNKRVIGIGLLGVALAGGGAYWFTQAKQAPSVTYTTTPAERGRLQSKVTATGAISALVTVQVGSQVSGRVSQLNVDFNSPVKKGQVLARLDPQLFQANLAQAQANLVSAQSALTRARIEAERTARALARSRQLFDRQLIARADLDTAQADADSARAQVASAGAGVEQARAGVNQSRLNLTYTTILSPIDGTVISRSVDVGQTVAASLQSPVLFEIAQDLRKEQVNAKVSEADVGKLKPGMKAEFTVAAFPAEKFSGTVRQVRNAAKTEQNVVTYDAIIDVNNPELKLKPGMTANVTFVYADRPNALRVPNAALRFSPPAEALGERGRAPARPGRAAQARPAQVSNRASHDTGVPSQSWSPPPAPTCPGSNATGRRA